MVNPGIRRTRGGSGVIMYFGAGYSRGYVMAARRAIPEASVIHGNETMIASTMMQFMPVALDSWPFTLAAAGEYVGTMGMAAYDAAAAGCKITVICRTEEHLADAKAAGFSIAGLGEPSIKQIQKARRRAKTCDLIDSAGVYRVAERILELAKT